MSKKFNIEFVKESFEKGGYGCLSNEYINSSTPLKYICPKGHVGLITWGSWQQGRRCFECHGSKKYTLGFIKSKFNERGCTLDSKEYIDNKTLLEYTCPNGHKQAISWSHWQRGRRCTECTGRKKRTIDFIQVEFEKEGWVCTSKEYINNKIPLEYVCSKGHVGSIAWTNWQQGKRCPECAGLKKPTIEFVRSGFEKEGWVLVSSKYINSGSPLNYICPMGHRGTITWSDWNRGRRCLTCSGKEKHTIDFVRSEFGKEGWTCISTKYIGAHSKLEYICSKGHRGSIAWTNWQRGRRCPKCNKTGTSIWEGTIKQFVKSLAVPFLENDRTQIVNPKTNCALELDLWFPDLSRAIECNGMYWHSKKDRKDLDKLKQGWCKDNNVSLLTITDTDWNTDIKECQTKIKNFLN